MTDVKTVVDGYIAMWNETDAGRRRELIAQTWTDDATYVDPHMAGEGPDGIDAMVAAVRSASPGTRSPPRSGPTPTTTASASAGASWPAATRPSRRGPTSRGWPRTAACAR